MTEATTPPEELYYLKIRGLEFQDANKIAQELQNSFQDAKEDSVKVELLLASLIREKMSEKERLRRKAIYRDGYRKRPEVKAKAELKKNDPVYIAARQAYANKPEVLERKRLKGQTNSLLLKTVKQEIPEFVVKVVGEEALKRKKPTRSKTRETRGSAQCCDSGMAMETEQSAAIPSC